MCRWAPRGQHGMGIQFVLSCASCYWLILCLVLFDPACVILFVLSFVLNLFARDFMACRVQRCVCVSRARYLYLVLSA